MNTTNPEFSGSTPLLHWSATSDTQINNNLLELPLAGQKTFSVNTSFKMRTDKYRAKEFIRIRLNHVAKPEHPFSDIPTLSRNSDKYCCLLATFCNHNRFFNNALRDD